MAAKPLNNNQLKDAERLRKIFELRKENDPSWSQEKLAHACGWKTQGTINQYLNGKIPLNLLAIKKFSEALKFSIEEVSPALALQVAELSKLSTASNESTSQNQFKKVVVADADDKQFIQIQKVKLRLSAGITGFHADIEHDNGATISIERSWVEKKGFAPEYLVAVKVKGESMEPALYEDDVVLVNTADTKPQDGVVYAINYEGEAVIKRLMRDAGEWWLTSDNADQRKYHKKICRGNECLIVGRVVKKESENI